MKFKVIIPARYQSTRLPGKPLLDIAGKPMIQRVYEAALKSQASEVLIATDDERIEKCALGFGAKVCMTLPEHPSGTDRLHEVVQQFAYENDDIVVNVQGDEPLMPPALINQVAKNLAQQDWASVSSLCEKIESEASLFDPNNVKVVFAKSGEALYFSRAPIPWPRNSIEQENFDEQISQVSFSYDPAGIKKINYFRHIGIYAYRVGFLKKYVAWEPSSLEVSESLEQLRALDNGHRIHMDIACEQSANGIDTEKDLEEVRGLFEKGFFSEK